eukprot:gene20056-6858_t
MDYTLVKEALELLTIGVGVKGYFNEKEHHDEAIDQANSQHREGLRTEHGMHEEAIKKERQMHEQALRQERQHHDQEFKAAMETFNEGLRQQHVQWGRDHFVTIKEQDRENMRDEMDQKNRRLDSAFTSATLMFGCALVREPATNGVPWWPPDLEDWDGLLQSANDTYNPLAGKETQVLITWGSFVCMSLLMTLWSMAALMLATNRFSHFNKAVQFWRDPEAGDNSVKELWTTHFQNQEEERKKKQKKEKKRRETASRAEARGQPVPQTTTEEEYAWAPFSANPSRKSFAAGFFPPQAYYTIQENDEGLKKHLVGMQNIKAFTIDLLKLYPRKDLKDNLVNWAEFLDEQVPKQLKAEK